MILLDTHIWLWWALAPDRLSNDQKNLLSVDVAAVCTISFWELALIESRGRISLHEPLPDWIHSNLATFEIQTLELTPAIASRANNLPDFDHRDPADRLIIATAIEHSVTLLTIDRVLLAYPHVKTL